MRIHNKKLKRKKRLIKKLRHMLVEGGTAERGQVLVIVALAIVGLIAAMGLAVDLAIVQTSRAELGAHVDAASLAGGEELPDTARARERAEQYLILHDIQPGDTTDPAQDCFIEFPAPGAGDNWNQDEAIDVTCKRNLNTSFIRVVGIDTVQVPGFARTLATSIWQADQTWTMFRGGPGRTGFQPCDGATANDGLVPPVSQVGFEWGHRWNSNDTENHRSTPAVYRKAGLFSGHAVVVHGSNGTAKGAADAFSGVYAWDSIDGSLLWFTPLDSVSDVRSSPLILDPVDPVLGGDDIPDTFNSGNAIVFVGAHNGKVYALDITDGSLIWETPNFNDSFETDGAYRSSPAFYRGPSESRGYLYQATSRGNVYKIDLLTGSIIWRSAPFPSNFPAASVPQGNPNLWNVPVVPDTTYAAANVVANWGYSPIYGTVNVTRLPVDHDANPATADIPQDVVFVITHGKKDFQSGTKPPPYLFAINAFDGSKIWESRSFDGTAIAGLGTGANDRNSAVVGIVDVDLDGLPVVDSDGIPNDPGDQWRVFGAPTDGYIYGFHANTGFALSDHTWATGTSPVTGVAPGTSIPGATYTGTKSHRSDPDLYCGVLFGGTEGAGMFAISAITGDSIWDGTDSDGAGAGPDAVNPLFESGANPGDCASATYNVGGVNVYNCFGTRMMPGGVKSSPAILSGIVLVGTNQPAVTSGGAVWALSARTGADLGHWDTGAYVAEGGIGPAVLPAGGGDVRSGLVVGPDNKAYWGSKDGGIYQLTINELLVLAK